MAMLDALAAPLGPMTDHTARLAQQDRWVEEGGAALLEALIALLAAPPTQLTYASRDDWMTLLVEITGTLGARHPEVALPRLVPLLADASARGAVLDVLGTVGDARALPALTALVNDPSLPEPDLLHLAGALGEIGGADARALLARLHAAVRPEQHALRREIEIAEQMARRG
ncbi:MAG TPA: hypothetical protein VFP84_26295 [Kofleriaceae bacterium]|nr:hypothetical protein [Kofleriaceae bacterium]